MSKWTAKLGSEERSAIASAVLDEGASQAAAAGRFGVSPSTAQRIVTAERERRRGLAPESARAVARLARVRRVETVEGAEAALHEWDGQDVVAEVGPVDGEPETLMFGTLKLDIEDFTELFPAITLDGVGASYGLVHFERSAFEFAETRENPDAAMRIVAAGRQLVIARRD
jgi:transposase-like protein